MNKTILKFEKPGCMPCLALDKLLDTHGIKVTKVNQVTSPEMFQEFNVKSVPTILVLDNENNVTKTIIGVVEHALIGLKEELNGSKESD